MKIYSSTMKSVFGILIIIILGSCSTNLNTTSFGKSVKGFPESYMLPSSSLTPTSAHKKTKLPWVVYSDRVGNYTTTTPGGTLLMEKINFMEPFYVSEEKDGYVKLLRFRQNMVKGLSLKDKKTVESIGWINKEKLLLWNKSYVSKNLKYADKALIIPNNADPFISPQFYFDSKDSVFVYDSPDLKNVIGKVALNNYAYIYKQSTNGKQYLIGTADQFVLKEVNRFMKGWVSSNVVSNWGNKLYLAPISFVEESRVDGMQSVNSRLDLSPNLYTIEPLADTSNILLSAVALGGNNMAYYSLPVFDKTTNRLTTINGSQMQYPSFLNLIKNRSKVNIIYVIDGGDAMKNRFAGLINTIQSFEKNIFDVFEPGDVKFGSVIYRSRNHCSLGNGELKLTKDYREVVSFLKEQATITASCRGGIDLQPYFNGIDQAVSLVNDVPQQTNLFVIIGSVGNDSDDSDARIPGLARKLAGVDARLLVMQSYNEPNKMFNDFIVQNRKLITSEAYYAAENRKFQSVQGEAFGGQIYDFNLSDSISYYLDFPKNSLIQGGIVFSNRKSSLNSNVYNVSFTRILKETKYDIISHKTSLYNAFRLTGISNRNIAPYIRGVMGSDFNDQVGDKMPHNEFNYAFSKSYSPTNLSELKGSDLEYNLILNEREYKEFLEVLAIVVGENIRGDDKNFRNKLLKNYYVLSKSVKKDRPKNLAVPKWTLSQYFNYVLGMPISPSTYGNIKVSSLNRRKDMSKDNFEEYIKYLQGVSKKVKDFSAEEGKFYSNGELYYRIKGSFFY